MTITIHQPEHMPWAGFFYKMMHADTFVILDHVQYRKNYFQNRNQILFNGKPNYITISVPTKGHMQSGICDMKVGENDWKSGYLNKIREAYKHHPYFKDHYENIADIINRPYEFLEEYNMSLIKYFKDFLSIESEFVHSRDLTLEGSKSDLILSICNELKADTYIAGSSGPDYLDVSTFRECGIDLFYNEYNKREYCQYKSPSFVPYMSILDIIMNLDKSDAIKLIEESFSLIKF